MKANDFISDIGDMLGENFSNAPIWTRANILSYLRETLRRFAQLTLIVDSDSLRYVSDTTGEANVSTNFLNAYYNTYDKVQLDIVSLGELDFVVDSWSSGTTGVSPLVSTVMGTGADTTIRVVPVPTNPAGSYGWTSVTSIILADSAGVLWNLVVDTTGVLSPAVVATGTTRLAVLGGPDSYWDLTVGTTGILTTTASSSTTAINVILEDSADVAWSVTTDDSGVLLTNRQYGKLTRFEITDINQDFTSNYGVVTNIYAQGVAVTPAVVARLDGPFGSVTMGRVSDGALHVWYKALIDDTPNTESEIYLNNCYIPIIQHGVLSLAYSAEGAGHDIDKAKALEMIFMGECDSVRRIFNKK